MSDPENFSKIANYLTHPLVLAGFAIFSFFGIHKLLITAGILSPVSQSQSSAIVKILLQYGYIVALVTILAGFSLKAWQEYISRPHTPLITAGRIEQLIIQEGDSPQLRQQKTDQAKRLIAQEIMSDISVIDARLGYIAEITKPDKFERKIRDTTQDVVPSAAEAVASGYRELMANARISSLRQAINSSILRSDFGKSLIQVLIDAKIDVKPVRNFYDQIAEVQWATESLFNALAEPARDKAGTESIWQDYYVQRIALAVETLTQRSEGAYIAGLRALYVLEAAPSDVNTELASLRYLEPNSLPDKVTLEQLLKKNFAKIENLVNRKSLLQEESQRLLEQETKNFGPDVEKKLEIKPTDSWNEVTGKAISLRQFGRLTEAMSAFYKYGQMFASTDPTAERYANTALAFTQQIKSLGLEGGVYVYRILEKGVASDAGLEVGDIIIEYDGNIIKGMNEMVPALSNSREGEIKRITYLRLESKTGRFTRHSSSIKGGPIGAGTMPI